MAKTKTTNTAAAPVISPTPVQQQTIQNPEALPQADQVSQSTQTDTTQQDQQPEVKETPQEQTTQQTNPMFSALTESGPKDNQPSVQELLPNENQAEPKKVELTFEERIKLKATARNAARSVNKLKDALLSLINPVETDDNPDRA